MAYIVFAGFWLPVDPHKLEDKNMNQFQNLQATAKELYSNEETRKWLFTHTRTEGEYAIVRHALKTLAEYRPVEWQGKPGNRRPVEVEA